MAQPFEEELKRALIERQILRPDQVQVVAEEQKQTGQGFEASCARLGLVRGATLKQLLSALSGVPYTDLSTVWTPMSLEIVSLEVLHRFFVFSREGNSLDVAVEDPLDVAKRDLIQRVLSQRLGAVHCRFFYTDAEALESALARRSPEETSSDVLAEDTTVYESAPRDLSDVSAFFEAFLQKAVAEGVSDVHLEPLSSLVRVRFREDGLLRVVQEFHPRLWPNLVIRIKILSNLDIAESRRPQSGHFTQVVCGQKCDFRVSTHPTIHGENVVIRILYRHKKLLSLAELGFGSEAIQKLEMAICQPYGLILLCGPTGSGKTTTLYTLCAQMDATTQNIMTLEEPVEYSFETIRQTEIQHADVMTFAEGVRSILRQDPDVLFIGEIRDEETAQMALRAAMTGHLVLSTVHSNDALRAPARLFDLGIPPSLLSGQLLMVMAQRLVRRTCSACQGSGCEFCRRTGFKGRLAISEILTVDPTIDTCISRMVPLADLTEAARAGGYRSLMEDGLEKVKAGLTTQEELQRVCGRKTLDLLRRPDVEEYVIGTEKN